MLSYILLFLSTISFLSRGRTLRIESKIYSLIITSSLFSYSILGLISLIIINLNKSKFPIVAISSLIFLLSFFFNKNSLETYSKIKNFLLYEFIKCKNDLKNLSQKFYIILISFLVILVTLSSLGPINHPDALDYHVGYPYQFWLRGRFFVDGGLHQALMGAGDYANLALIQEKSIWLIRYIQISNLPLITIFLLNNVKNKLYILAFISSSTFIQWGTIGKPLFLSESSCAIAYIIWKEYKDNLSRRLLLVCIFSCISIKISSLIVCTPILIDIFFDNFFNKKIHNEKNLIKFLKSIIFDKSILLSIVVLLGILFTRIKIVGNFAYPLLTNIFNKNDILINNFTEFISGYQKDGLFPLNIFLPISISDIASSLGPGLFLILLFLIFKTLKQINIKENKLFYICLMQIILLILFCQGRADYYALPMILLIYFSGNLDQFYKNTFLKLTLHLSIYFQILLIIGFLLFSINQNLLSILDYEKTMTKTSYGFDFSRLINQKTPGNFYQNVIRDARLFYPNNYISREMMDRCFQNNSQNICFEKYDITQILSAKDFLLGKEKYYCHRETFTSGARNPFNRKKREIEVCEKKKFT